MTLRLHWSPDSANLVVRIALEVLGLKYKPVRVNRAGAEHKSPEYLAKNPQGLIPVLEDGDLVLFETGAILWHLAERGGRLGSDGPNHADPGARAAALKWMFFLSNTLHADLRCAFYSHRWVPPNGIPDFRDGLRARIRGHCDLLEGQLAAGGLIGDTISLPDIYLCVCLRWAQIYPPGEVMLANLTPWPRVQMLATRIEGLPAARTAFGAEFIPIDQALTKPRPPALSREEVTGTI